MARIARMLSKTFGDSRESSSINRLVESRKELPEDIGEDGLETCSTFLEDLAAAAKILGVPSAPRDYRKSFTANYRAIFPDETRSYRVDVLEGCLESSTIWVNGDQFQLSPTTLTCANELRTAWADLYLFLDRWDTRSRSSDGAGKEELCQVIKAFDHAWTNLEHKYIEELINIEGKSKSILMEAVSCERKLSVLEAQSPAPTQSALRRATKDLVQSIGHLNSVSNHKRKGRNDLHADIFFAATRVMSDSKFAAARVLAADVLKSFEGLRVYLRKVNQFIESVDPHLGNNEGLVERIVDWEEHWEVGKKYLTCESSFNTLCDLVSSVQRLQDVEPKLTSMCEDCDVELFLVLPRLVLIRYLVAPERQTASLQALLPHRFTNQQAGPEVLELAAKFAQTRRAAAGLASDTPENAWKFFGVAALGEPSEAGELKAFMLELESWSVEVQRHCAEDWNQCSAVLVQCLSKSISDEKEREALDEFSV